MHLCGDCGTEHPQVDPGSARAAGRGTRSSRRCWRPRRPAAPPGPLADGRAQLAARHRCRCWPSRSRPASASSTACSAAASCRGSVTLLGGEPGIGKSTLLLQLLAVVAGSDACTSRPRRARSRSACGPNGSAPSGPTCGWPPRRRWRRRRRRSSAPPRRWSSSTASRPIADHTLGLVPGLGRPGPGVRPAARGRGQATWRRRRARRPRHQGRRPRRPAGARARRRHRPVVRGRAPPRTAAPAGGQAPLRLDRRARPVRDDRSRAWPASPTRRRCSSPTAAPTSPGSVVVPAMDGRRPLLVEVQALTVPIPPGVPGRRNAKGLDAGRLALLLAVLQRHAGVRIADHDVYASTGRRAARSSSPARTSPWRSPWPARSRTVPRARATSSCRRGRAGRGGASGRPRQTPPRRGGADRLRAGHRPVGDARRRRHRLRRVRTVAEALRGRRESVTGGGRYR